MFIQKMQILTAINIYILIIIISKNLNKRNYQQSKLFRMYEINLCSPVYSYTPVSNYNLTIIRFLLLTVLLLLYIMYLIIHFIMRRSLQNLNTKQQGNPHLLTLQTFKQKWQKQYMLMYGDHIVAVGFAIAFSPYSLQIILSFGYLILRVIYEIKLHKYSQSLKQIKTINRIINLALLVCAMVGLSRCGFDNQLGFCRDFDYRIFMPM